MGKAKPGKGPSAGGRAGEQAGGDGDGVERRRRGGEWRVRAGANPSGAGEWRVRAGANPSGRAPSNKETYHRRFHNGTVCDNYHRRFHYWTVSDMGNIADGSIIEPSVIWGISQTVPLLNRQWYGEYRRRFHYWTVCDMVFSQVYLSCIYTYMTCLYVNFVI